MGIVLFYAVLGGMKGITYTQVAQYCVLIFAYMVPAFFLAVMLSGTFIPQLGFGGADPETGVFLLDKLDGLHRELGFTAYTDGTKSMIDVFFITAALMVGTAGLPHVIIRFYTVPKVRDARVSVGWALLFIAILYTTAPAVAVFARANLLDTVAGQPYEAMPEWFSKWEDTGPHHLRRQERGRQHPVRRRPGRERTHDRPRHHGAREPGDLPAAELGRGTGGGRRAGGGAFDRGRTAGW